MRGQQRLVVVGCLVGLQLPVERINLRGQRGEPLLECGLMFREALHQSLLDLAGLDFCIHGIHPRVAVDPLVSVFSTLAMTVLSGMRNGNEAVLERLGGVHHTALRQIHLLDPLGKLGTVDDDQVSLLVCRDCFRVRHPEDSILVRRHRTDDIDQVAANPFGEELRRVERGIHDRLPRWRRTCRRFLATPRSQYDKGENYHEHAIHLIHPLHITFLHDVHQLRSKPDQQARQASSCHKTDQKHDPKLCDLQTEYRRATAPNPKHRFHLTLANSE